jgi:hypothetical protein
VGNEDARQLLSLLAASAARIFVSCPAALVVSHAVELDWLQADPARFSSFLVASRVLTATLEGAPLSHFAALFATASATDLIFADEAVAEDTLWRAVSEVGVPVSLVQHAAWLRTHRAALDCFSRLSGVDLMAARADRSVAVWLRRNGAVLTTPEEKFGWVHPGNFDDSGMDTVLVSAYKLAHKSRTRLWTLRQVRDALDASGAAGPVVHPRFDVNGTSTSRHTVVDPALQSVSRDVRSVISAPPGMVLVSADHCSAEVVVLAALVGNESLALRDVYQEVATVIGGDRKAVKMRVLAWMYGEGVRNCALRGGGDEQWAARLHEAIATLLPEVVTLRHTLEARVRAGQHLFTLRGRRLPLIPPTDAFKALNRVLQSSAKDAFAEGVAAVALLPAMRLILPLHDEIVVAVGHRANRVEVAAELSRAMAVVLPGGISMRSDVEFLGPYWGVPAL